MADAAAEEERSGGGGGFLGLSKQLYACFAYALESIKNENGLGV